MASLYTRTKSPYWWIEYIDGNGKRRQESTRCRMDSVQETRMARQLRAKREMEEMKSPVRSSNDQELEAWVQRWIDTRFSKQPHTLESYSLAWKHLLAFFKSQRITFADQIQRAHCFAYFDARKLKAAANTAIHDLVILRLILNEAINRNLITVNPAAKLGLKKEAPAEKPEITESEARIIEAALPTLPEWMAISWHIAWNQGCRLAETALPLSDVDTKRQLITFTLKGGRRHTTRLHPALIPLILKFKKEKRLRTWEFSRNASRDWSRVLDSLGLKHLTFHSTRVTVITRMARSGNVNEQQAMRFIGHATEQVHAIYQRLKTSDLDACLAALGAEASKDKPRKP